MSGRTGMILARRSLTTIWVHRDTLDVVQEVSATSARAGEGLGGIVDGDGGGRR